MSYLERTPNIPKIIMWGMEQVWNRNPREVAGDTSLEMLHMSRAPGIQIYRMTALPTARELELDGL